MTRLVFYEDDIEVMHRALVDARREARLRAASVIHVQGWPIVEDRDASDRGDSVETLAAVTAASFAACRETGRFVGPPSERDRELDEVRMRVGLRCLLLARFAEPTILALEYDLADTTQDLVDLHAGQAIERLAKKLAEIQRRPPPEGPLEDMSPARLRPGDPPRRPPPKPGESAKPLGRP